jgi:hypothetical protein
MPVPDSPLTLCSRVPNRILRYCERVRSRLHCTIRQSRLLRLDEREHPLGSVPKVPPYCFYNGEKQLYCVPPNRRTDDAATVSSNPSRPWRPHFWTANTRVFGVETELRLRRLPPLAGPAAPGEFPPFGNHSTRLWLWLFQCPVPRFPYRDFVVPCTIH